MARIPFAATTRRPDRGVLGTLVSDLGGGGGGGGDSNMLPLPVLLQRRGVRLSALDYER